MITRQKMSGWSAIAALLAISLMAGCDDVTKVQPIPKVVEPVADATPEPAAPAEEAVAKEEGSASEEGKPACCASKTEAKCPKCAGKCRPLFNGKDLAGWRNARNPEGENTWFVEDGAMTNVKAEGDHGVDLATVDVFKDFCLHIEYKTIPGGNSGVYLRGRVEVQVLDSHGNAEVTTADAGAIYDKFAPLVNAAKPAGEWHSLNICYLGDRLTVLLNDQLVLDNIHITETTGGAMPGNLNEPGPVMLQGDHGKVWYQNARICEIDPANPCCKPEDGAKTFENCPMATAGACPMAQQGQCPTAQAGECPTAQEGQCPMAQGEGSATEAQSEADFEASIKLALADFKAGMESHDIDKIMAPISENFDHYEYGDKEMFKMFLEDTLSSGNLDNAEIDFESAEITIEEDRASVYPVEMLVSAATMTIEFTIEKEDDEVWRVTSLEVEGI